MQKETPLNCFLQFTCTNLDGSQKEAGNFLNLFQKEGGTQKGRVPSENGGVPTLVETMLTCSFRVSVSGMEHGFKCITAEIYLFKVILIEAPEKDVKCLQN